MNWNFFKNLFWDCLKILCWSKDAPRGFRGLQAFFVLLSIFIIGFIIITLKVVELIWF